MKLEILGIRIDRIFRKEALIRINEFLRSEKSNQIVTVNPEFIMAAQEDKEFKKILNQAALSLPDGVGLILTSWYLKKPLRERITGVDLIYDLADLASREKKSIYFFGAADGIAKNTALNLKQKYSHLKIAGFDSGLRFHWFHLPDNVIISKINRSKADILLVALGAPKQEKWIYNHLHQFKSVKVAIGVGGAFDYISQNVKRAPKIFRKIGLEWLWRFIKQPWRSQRILTATYRFSKAIISEKNK